MGMDYHSNRQAIIERRIIENSRNGMYTSDTEVIPLVQPTNTLVPGEYTLVEYHGWSNFALVVWCLVFLIAGFALGYLLLLSQI